MRVVLAVVGVVLVLAVPLIIIRGRQARAAQSTVVDPVRRSFLNHVLIGTLGLFAVAFGGASVAMLWPETKRGFGAKIVAGRVDDLKARFEESGPVYNVEGRFYIVEYATSDADNIYLRAGVLADGLMALSQKCSHLGCRVPFCPTSQYFECPCHGARFNLAGEVRRGPAPAGMWRYRIDISPQGDVIVDTSRRVAQPPADMDTTNQQPAGSYCTE